MLDVETGTINFRSPGVSIGPALTRSAFLASPLSESSVTIVENEPHHSWKLAGSFTSAIEFLAALYFYGEELAMVSLADANPKFGVGDWSQWSEEKELARRASHDAWLDEQLGARREFPWGQVFSKYDNRSGASTIGICYPTWGRQSRSVPR
jgi:hypothetical protein